MDELLGNEFQVLDHGFVRVMDYMGGDESIVQAARVSYGQGTKSYREDEGLIRYLMRNHHTSPFEMCEIKLHCKMPIFVARQWVRHRTASINEYSARYSVLKEEFYIPEPEQIRAQSKTNRQGRGELLSDHAVEQARRIFQADAERQYGQYEFLLNEGDTESNLGVARELARMDLTLNFYTEWYWKINLHNLLHFLLLRADEHAQYEIRVYADAIIDIVRQWVPMTYRAWMDFQKDAVTFSGQEMKILRQSLQDFGAVALADGNISTSERREMYKKLGMA